MSHRFRILNLIFQYYSPPQSSPSQPWRAQPTPPPPSPTSSAQPAPTYYRQAPLFKSPCANFGLYLLIIAIISIIIFYAVPWFSISARTPVYDDNGDGKEYIGHYGQDFEWMFGDDELRDFYGDEYLEYPNDAQDFLGGTIGMAIMGLIFIVIIAIIAIIIGCIPGFHNRWPKISCSIDALFGVSTILPTLMIMFCCMRFLGRDLEFAHNLAVADQLGHETYGWIIHPAAYVLLIISIIILFLAISIIKRGLERVRIEEQKQAFRQSTRPRTTLGARPAPQARQRY